MGEGGNPSSVRQYLLLKLAGLIAFLEVPSNSGILNSTGF